MDADEIARVLAQVARDNEINCTGPGEVGCKGRTGWHSWTEHRAHVAQSQAELLAHLVEQARQEGAREDEEWAVRFGDGEIEWWTCTREGVTRPYTRAETEAEIQRFRDDIADPQSSAVAEDYEPMTLLRRTRRTFAEQVTEWTPAERAARTPGSGTAGGGS